MVVFGRLVAISTVVMLFTYFLAMGMSILYMVATGIGLDLLNSPPRSLLLGAFGYESRTPIQVNSLAVFLTTFAIYIGCFAGAIRKQGGLTSNLKGLVRGVKRRVPNWLVVMPVGSSALLFLVFVITLVEAGLGIPTGSISFPSPSLELYTLAYTPIVEEMTFRITTLGLLVVLIVLFSSAGPAGGTEGRLALKALLLPDEAKIAAGLPSVSRNGWRGIHFEEWILLAITSAWFGACHVVCGGGGWQLGKVATASLSGLALGLAYIVYGAYASILLHWFFNFYVGVFDIGAMLLGTGFEILADIILLLSLSLGVLGLFVLPMWTGIWKGEERDTSYIGPQDASVSG